MGRKISFLIVLLLCLNIYYITDIAVIAKNYTIAAHDSLVLSFEESSESVVILDIEKYDLQKIDIEVKNLSGAILCSRYNYTLSLQLAFIKQGLYTVNITNPNDVTTELNFERDSFPVVSNSQTGGYSYKNDLYCWSFNSVDEVYSAILPISSVKAKYYEMYFIVENIDVQANIWLSFKNPLSDIDWSTYLEPVAYSRNGKVSVKVEADMAWLVVDLSLVADYDVLVILYDAPAFTVLGKVLVGIASVGVAIVVFLGIYHDPLKFRKRKVDGESYDKIKGDYESTEDMRKKIKEVFDEEE